MAIGAILYVQFTTIHQDTSVGSTVGSSSFQVLKIILLEKTWDNFSLIDNTSGRIVGDEVTHIDGELLKLSPPPPPHSNTVSKTNAQCFSQLLPHQCPRLHRRISGWISLSLAVILPHIGPIPDVCNTVCRYQWPLGLMRRYAAVRVLGLWVGIPPVEYT